MRQRVCNQVNMFFWRVLYSTQHETKSLWAAEHVLFYRVLNLIQYETKGLWPRKHVLLKSVSFSTVWDKGFLISKTCLFEECKIYHSMRQRVCDQLNIFFWRVLNLTQYETKVLWPGKHVLLKSAIFNTVWEKGFLIS